jgi:hypothetical protein
VTNYVARAYVDEIVPHFAEPPSSSIHSDHPLHDFSSHDISDFLTLYFPTTKCTLQFQNLVSARFDEFFKDMFPRIGRYTESPGSSTCMASGWIKKTQIIGKDDVKGFMIYIQWTDQASEQRFKDENPKWRSLMADLQAMDVRHEEVYHGRMLQVLRDSSKEQFEFSFDSDEEDEHDKISISARDRLQELSESYRASTFEMTQITCRGMGAPRPAIEEKEIVTNRSQLDLSSTITCKKIGASEPELTDTEDKMSSLEQTIISKLSVAEDVTLALKFPTLCIGESDLEKLELEQDYDDSSECSTLFTPSSSTVSLGIFEESSATMDSEPEPETPEKMDEAPGSRANYVFESDNDEKEEEIDQQLVALAESQQRIKNLPTAVSDGKPTTYDSDTGTYTKPESSQASRSTSLGLYPCAEPGILRHEITRPPPAEKPMISRNEPCGSFISQLDSRRALFRSHLNPSSDFSSRDNTFWQNRTGRREEASWWAYIKGALLNFASLHSSPRKELKADEIAGKIDKLTCQSLGSHRGTRIKEERRRRAEARVVRIH